MNTAVLDITVTTAPGRPRMTLPADLSMQQLQDAVRDAHGLQVPGGVMGMPHSFCASRVPPEPRDPNAEANRRALAVPFLMRRGHNRVV